MPSDRSFEGQWLELSRSLQQMLRGRGLDSNTTEDIVQETGLRLFRMWNEVDLSRPLIHLAATIALNLMRDLHRTERTRAFSEVPDRAAQTDVERSAIARLDLHRAAKAMRGLSPSYRDALLGDVVADRVGPLTSSAKMARMRARRKLTAMLGTASSLWGWFSRRFEAYVQPAAGAVVVAAFVISGVGADVQNPAQTTRPEHGTVTPTTAGMRASDTPPGTHTKRAAAVASAPDPSDAESARSAAQTEPLRIPLGSHGEAEASARIEAGDVEVQVGNSGGPLPACVGGLGSEPQHLRCDDPESGSR